MAAPAPAAGAGTTSTSSSSSSQVVKKEGSKPGKQNYVVRSRGEGGARRRWGLSSSTAFKEREEVGVVGLFHSVLGAKFWACARAPCPRCRFGARYSRSTSSIPPSSQSARGHTAWSAPRR